MKVSAIIVAAGSGTRLGHTMPKAFVSINGLSLLCRVLRTVAMVQAFAEVVVAVPAGAESSARTEVARAGLQIPVKITEGGAERQESVRLALMLTSTEADLIVVHDAARPFAPPTLFSACISAASQNGAAIAAIPVADTLKQVSQGGIVTTLQRTGLWQAQTPQVFGRELLKRAHMLAEHEKIAVTDDSHLCERLGTQVRVIPGSALNLKITTPDDLRLAEALASLYPLIE
jgi:2-C-methyl-D-erythritol 4-phosphate cytidylyltransferase